VGREKGRSVTGSYMFGFYGDVPLIKQPSVKLKSLVCALAKSAEL
jgi:hypothetical protein